MDKEEWVLTEEECNCDDLEYWVSPIKSMIAFQELNIKQGKVCIDPFLFLRRERIKNKELIDFMNKEAYVPYSKFIEESRRADLLKQELKTLKELVYYEFEDEFPSEVDYICNVCKSLEEYKNIRYT